ncbi:MAG: LacI family DNA-binding transcriptional regulator [Trueperaceae bacterium]|nr:LacI family DNA-binding transcriptional regulator [Trueperaceae bacterium]
MPDRPPTLHDVARHAAVSTATVSRVVNGGAVADATARVVRDAIRDLGYVPNPAARGLITGRSDVVGILVPDLVGPLNAAIARGVEDVLEAHDKLATIMTDHRDEAREARRVATLVARRVDGLVLIGSHLHDAPLRDLVGDTPVVHVGAERPPGDGGVPEVRIDNHAGIDAALAHLAALGHRDVAHLAGPRRDGAERRAALRTLAPRHGLRVRRVVDTDFSEESGRAAGATLLADGDATAVLCANDRVAAGFYAAARERGLHLPDDLSVVGFDDLPWSAYLDPPLTTVRQPGRALGRDAAARLFDAGAGPPAPVTPDLVPRDSTVPPPR